MSRHTPPLNQTSTASFRLAQPRRILAVALLLLSIVLASCAAARNDTITANRKIPVIFDTDICDDIDDTWALALMLQSPEFDVRLITTEVGNTYAKARTVAKFLQTVGRTDIPIGIGLKQHDGTHRQDAWAKDYDLSKYPGKIHENGVQAIIDTVMKSKRPVKIVAVGPLPNIDAALKKEPRIAKKALFVGMHGSVRRGYGNSPDISPEYNVRAAVKEAQTVFTAPWKMIITPLDTCGIIHLRGQKYQKVLKKNSPITNALIQNYRAWCRQPLENQHKDWNDQQLDKKTDEQVGSASSTLFDTVAVYLAMSTDLAVIEDLGIKVTDDGYTRIDDNAKVISCATKWKDLAAFEDLLVERLTK